ncbi:MAG: hypothetical protein WC707_03140 [Candidatus Babeliaceae bacterium]|jgi:hypothetical protein
MKKLLFTLVIGAAGLVAVSELSANRCGRCPREKTVCGPKVCNTKYINHPIPTLKCVKEVEVAAPCSLEKIVETSYIAKCDGDYHEKAE